MNEFLNNKDNPKIFILSSTRYVEYENFDKINVYNNVIGVYNTFPEAQYALQQQKSNKEYTIFTFEYDSLSSKWYQERI